ncbi:MAG: response regulator [Planctomycetota bacterium]
MRILFVDDEPQVLNGLRRCLRDMRDEWEMSFAGGGDEALAMLEAAPFDVVVSDMQMPGMTGAELLTEVKQRCPDCVRIVLSGQADSQSIVRSAAATHLYLDKPCDPERLKEAVKRACRLRSLTERSEILQWATAIDSVPSQPAAYTRIVTELRSDTASIASIAEAIAGDVGVSAKILQIANSAFFGPGVPAPTIERAIVFLGLATVAGLVLGDEVFSVVEGEPEKGAPAVDLMEHSLNVAAVARHLGQASGCPQGVCEEAFLAGTLHDVGSIVLSNQFPERFRTVHELQAGGATRDGAMTEVFGVSAGEMAAYLVGLWGFPDGIVEAVAARGDPATAASSGIAPVTLLHVAESLCAERLPAEAAGSGALDLEYLAGVGLPGDEESWRASYTAVAGRSPGPSAG